MNKSTFQTKLFVSFCCFIVALLTGCLTPQNTPTVAELATPARIQAVTALGAYYGATAAIADGKRAVIVTTRDVLAVLASSEKVDLPAVIVALQAAGVTFLESQEGVLTSGAALLFSDLWSGTAEKLLDEPRVRAVIAGCIRGFDMALANKKPRDISAINIAHAELVDDVIATRRKKQ